MATDNSSSLSKDETIEQLRETIGQLEAIIQNLEETTVGQLPSSEPLQSLSTTTSELETIIEQEVVTASQEPKNQVEQEQISQEVDAILELTTPEIEQENVSAEQTEENPEKSDEQSKPDSYSEVIEAAEQEAISAEQVTETKQGTETIEQSEPENISASTEETEPEVVTAEKAQETSEQTDKQLEPENPEDSAEPETKEPETLEQKTPETVQTVEPPQEPVKKAAKTTKKPRNNKQQKNKPKNQAPKKKKKGWLVGIVVAAIALIAITLTLKLAPISDLPQLLANNSVVDRPANSVKTRSSATKVEPDLPLEPPIEVEETTGDSEKIDLEKIASQPNKDDQVDESTQEEFTQTEPEQFDSTPKELDAEQPLLADNPEPEIIKPEIIEPELEAESEQALTQEADPEEPEETFVIAEETKPITKLTSEQNLIVAVGRKADNLAERYDDDLIVSIKPDFAASVVSVTLSDDWYQLLGNRQDRFLGEMFRRSQQLEFDKLMITDSDDNLIARSPVIGQEMVIFRRTS